MDFGYTPEQQALQQEVRQFIVEQVTPEVLRELEVTSGQDEEGRRGRGPLARELYRKIGDKGWIGISWPKEYGGQGGDRISQYIVEEEFARMGLSVGGVGSGGPAILVAGTEEQKKYFLPGLISGEIVLALGFTEPSAGADLASLQTRAVEDGDEYVINGQKMYTTAAHYSTHIYLMCRTDPDLPKHKGISIFLIPMDTPGITVRPLYTLKDSALPGSTSETRTNEVFLENVRVPRTAMLGEKNQGWYVGAMGLNLDRVGAGRYIGAVRATENIIRFVREAKLDGYSLAEDPAVRDKLAELYVDAQVCRLFTMRSMSMVNRNIDFTYEGSAEKVWAPEHGIKAVETISQILGPYMQLLDGSELAINRGEFSNHMLGAWLFGVNHGSVQVMRDQVARRGLGLPRG